MSYGKIHEDGQENQIKWFKTISDQVSSLSFFINKCGSNLVCVIASFIGEHLGRVGGGLYGKIFPSSLDI